MSNPKASSLHSVALDWAFSQSYVADDSTVAFFRRLQDDGRVFGRRCRGCHKVLCPPRDVCGFCCSRTDRWIELESTGELRTLTIATTPFHGFPDPPYAFGFVQLGGASTALLGFLIGPNWNEPRNLSELIGSQCTLLPASGGGAAREGFSFRIDSGV